MPEIKLDVTALFLLLILFLFVWPLWRIVDRTGFPGVLSLLFFVPGVNLIMLYVLAFAEWPRNWEGRR